MVSSAKIKEWSPPADQGWACSMSEKGIFFAVSHLGFVAVCWCHVTEPASSGGWQGGVCDPPALSSPQSWPVSLLRLPWRFYMVKGTQGSALLAPRTQSFIRSKDVPFELDPGECSHSGPNKVLGPLHKVTTTRGQERPPRCPTWSHHTVNFKSQNVGLGLDLTAWSTLSLITRHSGV